MRDDRSGPGAVTWLGAGLAALLILLPFLDFSKEDKVPAKSLDLTPVAFSDLPDWANASAGEMDAARAGFQRTCERLLKSAGTRTEYGTARDWQAICDAAGQASASAAFFEEHFQPYLLSAAGDGAGHLTGYYEPLLQGSRTRSGSFQTPLHGVPDDLVEARLGDFDEGLKGKVVRGRVEGGRLKPYPDREAIVSGALGADADLIYVDDPVAAFFLQIQGSGRVALQDGTSVRVGYAGQNGRSYRAIGRDLISAGYIAREDISLQTIRAWLADNPDQAGDMMNKNPSYVFFRELPVDDPDLGPPGAAGIPLTPGHSLAIDRSYHALGLPFWVSTKVPVSGGATFWNRLMIAQDTGGAIKGPLRGDVFFGYGPDAEFSAGHMNAMDAALYLLLPKAAAPNT